MKPKDLKPGMTIMSDDGPVQVVRVQPGFIRYASGPAMLITHSGGYSHVPVDSDIAVVDE